MTDEFRLTQNPPEKAALPTARSEMVPRRSQRIEIDPGAADRCLHLPSHPLPCLETIRSRVDPMAPGIRMAPVFLVGLGRCGPSQKNLVPSDEDRNECPRALPHEFVEAFAHPRPVRVERII